MQMRLLLAAAILFFGHSALSAQDGHPMSYFKTAHQVGNALVVLLEPSRQWATYALGSDQPPVSISNAYSSAIEVYERQGYCYVVSYAEGFVEKVSYSPFRREVVGTFTHGNPRAHTYSRGHSFWGDTAHIYISRFLEDVLCSGYSPNCNGVERGVSTIWKLRLRDAYIEDSLNLPPGSYQFVVANDQVFAKCLPDCRFLHSYLSGQPLMGVDYDSIPNRYALRINWDAEIAETLTTAEFDQIYFNYHPLYSANNGLYSLLHLTSEGILIADHTNSAIPTTQIVKLHPKLSYASSQIIIGSAIFSVYAKGHKYYIMRYDICRKNWSICARIRNRGNNLTLKAVSDTSFISFFSPFDSYIEDWSGIRVYEID